MSEPKYNKKNYIINKESVLYVFFNFLKKPDYNIEINKSKFAKKLWDVFRLWALAAFVAVVVGLIFSKLVSSLGLDTDDNAVLDLFREAPIYLFVLSAFLWAPIFEETAFRLGLKFSPFRLGFACSFLFIVFLDVLFVFNIDLSKYFNWFLGDASRVMVILFYLILLIVPGIILGFLFKFLNKEKINKFYQKKFFFLYYFSSIFFGIVHLFNYNNFKEAWYLMIFLATPQIIIGLILGFVRMRYGINWSMILHFIHNSLLSAPLIIFSFLSEETTRIMVTEGDIQAEKIVENDILLIALSSMIFLFVAILAFIAIFSLLNEFRKKIR